MRTALAHLLVVTFVSGALAWSVDVHALTSATDPAVTVHQAVHHASDPATDNVHSDHCGHFTAHFTGLPVVWLAASLYPGHPDWPGISTAHLSLTETPPTPPPNR